MIVVEGPDGAGKTTLVKTLSEMYGMKVGKRGVKDRDLLYTVTVSDTMRALSRAVRGHKDPVIWDRLYYSDFVYAPIQHRPVAFNASHQKHVDAVIAALRCPVIVCLPPLEDVMANAAKAHQMQGVTSGISLIHAYYVAMTFPSERAPHGGPAGHPLKDFPEHRVVYDYTQPTMRAVLDEINDYLEERKERIPC